MKNKSNDRNIIATQTSLFLLIILSYKSVAFIASNTTIATTTSNLCTNAK